MADGAVQRGKINRGVGGSRPVTLRQVAEHAGVSPAAVSRAFQTDAPISDILRARVRSSAEELGYRPNRLASGLAGGHSGLVGLVAEDFGDPTLLELVQSTTQALKEAGLGAFLLIAGSDESAELVLTQVQDYALEGLIVLGHSATRPFLRQLELSGVPTAHAFEFRSASPVMPQAGVRDVLAARLAVMTLRERGYSKLGMVAGPDGPRHHRDPAGGFRTTAKRHGIDAQILHASGWSAQDGAGTARHLVDELGCDGLFCATDLLAVGALGGLRSAGRDVPGQIGLIGYDDAEFASWPGIELSSIAFPRSEIAGACVSRFLEMRSDPDATAKASVLQPQLIERGTLRAIAT